MARLDGARLVDDCSSLFLQHAGLLLGLTCAHLPSMLPSTLCRFKSYTLSPTDRITRDGAPGSPATLFFMVCFFFCNTRPRQGLT